jgi:hypothetical protein
VHARRVVIRRGDPDHEVVAADVGEAEAPVDAGNLAQLDAEGHILERINPNPIKEGMAATARAGPQPSGRGAASTL